MFQKLSYLWRKSGRKTLAELCRLEAGGWSQSELQSLLRTAGRRGPGAAPGKKPAAKPGRETPPSPPYPKGLLFEADAVFNHWYDLGCQLSGTPERAFVCPTSKRRERFYSLLEFFKLTDGLPGGVVECGCWKGLSSFLLCQYQRLADPAFRGEHFHIFDSFAGLSAPTAEDVLTDPGVLGKAGVPAHPAGDFAGRLDEVRQLLGDFPAAQLHQGWIPESLCDDREPAYRFVHVDVDLHQPTRGAIDHFYPKLSPGGVLVCDDYGSLRWPGAKKAVDDFAREHGLKVLSTSIGQGVLIKSQS